MIETREEILAYLDKMIYFWRGEKDKASTVDGKLIPICYIDAFQSARVSIFDELLP